MRSIFEITPRSGIKYLCPTPLPIQVQRRPSEPLPLKPAPGEPGDQLATAKAHQQQQQQHREALRLALGSILTPKRPPIVPPSRPSSGTATPAHPSPWLSGSVSGAQTPAGTPPIQSPYIAAGHGPNSSEHLLHPHYAFPHHGHSLPPSKLGRSSSSSNSPVESVTTSTHNSGHPSPHAGAGALAPHTILSPVPDVEPLPPSMMAEPQVGNNTQTEGATSNIVEVKPVRPSITPLHPSKEGNAATGADGAGSTDSMNGHIMQTEPGSPSGRGTPRAKFLQTLQSKSAWDALIHGSFS
uniref:Uncharacterized protein n=1 Tax=Psilocybe cubensis TaxID=181762 RepID=A0A8H7XLC2_PSICU